MSSTGISEGFGTEFNLLVCFDMEAVPSDELRAD
jgi:hypothetical protein